MPEIELSEVEVGYVELLLETRERAIAEARRKCDKGLRVLLKAHGHQWPDGMMQLNYEKADKPVLEWEDKKEKNDGSVHPDPGPAGRPEGGA